MSSTVARLVEWPAAAAARARVVSLPPSAAVDEIVQFARLPRLATPQPASMRPDPQGHDREAFIVSTFWRRLGRAWRATLNLSHSEGLHHIATAEWEIAELPQTARATLHREINLMRATAYALRDESSAALAILRKHLQVNEAPGPLARTICRFAFWQQRDFESLRHLPPTAPHGTLVRRAIPLAVFDLALDAAICMEQLRFPLAKRLAFEAIELARRAPRRADAAADLAACIAAQIAYEEGSLDDAERLVMDRLPNIRSCGHLEAAIRAFDVMARVAKSRRRPDLALLILDDAEALGLRRGWPRLIAASLQRRIQILLAARRLEEAECALARLQVVAATPGKGDYIANDAVRQHAAVSGARVAGAIAPSPRVVAMFRRLQGEALDRGDLLAATELSIGLAESTARSSETEAGAAILLTALRQGSAAGLFRVFVESGPAIKALMIALLELGEDIDPEGQLAPYLQSVLSCQAREANSPARPRPKARPGLISLREAAILRLIADGSSNKRIAQAMGIAPETVKSHAKNIFAKLDARTRMEAAHRAQGLGLI